MDSTLNESITDASSIISEEPFIIQSLLNCIKVNDITMFKNILQNNYIPMNSLESLFLTCINSYKVGKIHTLRYISMLLSYNVNPNINIVQNSYFPQSSYGNNNAPFQDINNCNYNNYYFNNNNMIKNSNVNNQKNKKKLKYKNSEFNEKFIKNYN